MTNDLQRRLIDRFQRHLPLVATPFAEMAEAVGASEAEVIAALDALHAAGALSRVGAVVEPNTAGASTLAAIAVPSEALDEVAALVSAVPEVNHNYEREHELNLWFVVTAGDPRKLERALERIEAETGYPVVRLPLEEAYHLDTGFPIRWN